MDIETKIKMIKKFIIQTHQRVLFPISELSCQGFYVMNAHR